MSPKRNKQRPKVPKTEEQKKAQSISAAIESLQAVASGMYGGIQTRSGKRLANVQPPPQQQPQTVEEDKEGTAISAPVEEEEDFEQAEFVDAQASPEEIAEQLAQRNKLLRQPPPPSPRQLYVSSDSPAQGTLNFSMLIRLYRPANARTSSSNSSTDRVCVKSSSYGVLY